MTRLNGRTGGTQSDRALSLQIYPMGLIGGYALQFGARAKLPSARTNAGVAVRGADGERGQPLLTRDAAHNGADEF